MRELFQRWFCGDEAAVAFAHCLWTAIQEWDDLHDEGRCEDHNTLLSWLAFGKEYTPYFAANAHILRPALLMMYLSWRAANELERGQGDDLAKAYMLRAAWYQVLHVMAWIAGGDVHAATVGPEIYRTYGETLAGFIEEMSNA